VTTEINETNIGLVWLLYRENLSPVGLLIQQMIHKMVNDRADYWAGRYNFPKREHYMLALRDYCIDPGLWEWAV
jgi:hypothetical protein